MVHASSLDCGGSCKAWRSCTLASHCMSAPHVMYGGPADWGSLYAAGRRRRQPRGRKASGANEVMK